MTIDEMYHNRGVRLNGFLIPLIVFGILTLLIFLQGITTSVVLPEYHVS